MAVLPSSPLEDCLERARRLPGRRPAVDLTAKLGQIPRQARSVPMATGVGD